MFCQYCGNEVKEGTKFCTKCGQKILKNEDGEETLSISKERGLIQIRIVAIIVITVITVIAMLLFWKTVHNYTISEGELRDLIEKEEIAKLDVNGTEMLLTPEKV